MKFKELLKKTRSYRRFYQEQTIPMADLEDMIADARLTPSPGNLQPLKYILVNDSVMNEKIFSQLKWAGYLTDWPGPVEGERPAAYIIMLGNPKTSGFVAWDYGIALQAILLSAMDKGYGACAFGAFSKEKVRVLLDIPGELDVSLIIALGKPKETVVLEDVVDNNVKYWRDEKEVHHVPKRKLTDLIVKKIAS